MALSNMAVFNDYLQGTTIETLAQMVEKFNAASRGAIQMTTEGFDGDFFQQSMWASIHSAVRRVDRYATNTTASATPLSQLQMNTVKVAGGFGPILFEPSQLTWIQKNPTEALEVISRNFAEAMMQDMLNSAIGAAVAAIGGEGTATSFDAGTGPLTYRDMNRAHAKFGDMSSLIVANVIDGVTYHDLIDQNLQNTQRLFFAQGIQVVDILGRVVVVTDAPALRTSGTGAETRALGLVAGGIVVHNIGDLVMNTDITNGKERIETTWQADYAYGLGLKGYSWDTSTGGKSPVDADLVNASAWDKTATSIKNTAGVLAYATA
jgi:hypothetical protein